MDNKKLVRINLDMTSVERNELYADIDSHELVECLFEESDLNKLIEKNADIWWTGDAESYFENELGFKVVSSGNTYNHESELTDIIQWSIMVPGNSTKGDDIYEDGIILIQFHLGGDARGNYGSVKAYKWCGEDTFSFFDTCVGWYASSGKDADGNDLDSNALESLMRHFEQGYAANPTHQLGKALEAILDVSEDAATVKLVTGETITIHPQHNAECYRR